jgi:hypothetical protein
MIRHAPSKSPIALAAGCLLLLSGVASTLVAVTFVVFVAQSEYEELAVAAALVLFPLPATTAVAGIMTFFGSRIWAAVGAGTAGLIALVGIRQTLNTDTDPAEILLLMSALPAALLAGLAAGGRTPDRP